MKKLVSLMLSAAVVLSSMSVFAAPGAGSGSAAAKVNSLGTVMNLPAEIEIDLDAKVGINNNYGDYATEGSAYKITTSTGSGEFDAVATIDMTEVAEAWFEYIAAGVDYICNSAYGVALGITEDQARAMILDTVSLADSYFDVEIVSNKEIANLDIATNAVWVGDADTLFDEEAPAVYGVDGDTHVYRVRMKPAAGITNADFNDYFTDVLDDTKEEQYLEFSIADNTVTGEYNVPYRISSRFSGEIVIGLPGTVSGGGTSEFVIEFDDTDVNFVKLGRPSGGGGVRPTAKPTEAPTEAPTEVPTEAPTAEPTATPEPQIGGTASGATLNYDNHYAYIIGYDAEEDGSIEVRPENSITRAEVATIFYRLLDDASREKFLTKSNSFPDVDSDDWYNNAVSTVAAAGIVEGYDDGTFGPDRAITRAEFATIASRFSTLTHDGEPMFTDVAGHWAEDYINCAAVTGWVNGYDDGTFRPEAKITRAEAITLINRVLYRTVDSEGLLAEGYIDFVDNAPSAWYYIAILEASNSHDYDREKLGALETHKELTENIDWDAHEE